MIDITIYENYDGGDLALINDDLDTALGLENLVYLGLFGGNVQQVTEPSLSEIEQRFDWFGNDTFDLDFNSEFERELQNTIINSSGLVKLENAIKKDLEFLQEYGNIEVEANLIDVNRIDFTIVITEPDNQSTQLNFIWDGTKNAVIYDNTNI